jgi:hypothetical protein
MGLLQKIREKLLLSRTITEDYHQAKKWETIEPDCAESEKEIYTEYEQSIDIIDKSKDEKFNT